MSKRGRPSNTEDPYFVVFIVREVEGWLAAQGKAGKRLNVAQACRSVLLIDPARPHVTVGRLQFLRTAESRRQHDQERQANPFGRAHVDHQITDVNTLRNVYLRCLRWIDANPDSPGALLLERERQRKHLRGRIGKPPEFLCK